MWITVLLIIVSSVISSIGIVNIYLHKSNYGTHFNAFLIILIYILDHMFYFALFSISTIEIFNENISLLLWKLSLTMRLFTLAMLSCIHTFSLEHRNFKFLPLIFYALLGGIILSQLWASDSLSIISSSGRYMYFVQNPFLLSLITIYNYSIIAIALIFQIFSYSQIRDNYLAKVFNLIIIHFTVIISMYILYLVTQSFLFRDLHVIVFLISAIFILYITIRRPDLFVLLTNKIYDFVIFHRSGILLYSYNFETNSETDESILKGTILIGINHILSRFLDKRDQLNLIKMKNRDIILEYDVEFGYAILLITNQKNTIIETSLKNFTKEFNSYYREALKKINDYNQLIDVSIFKDTKKIIREHLSPYLQGNNYE